MLNRVHSNTTNLGPAVALDLVLVVSATCLQHGLVNTTATGDDANHGSIGGWDHLFGARRQLDPGPLGIGIMGDDCSIISRGSGDTATVAGLFFQVGHDGTLRHATNGHNVANGQLRFLATVDELTGVHTLSGDKEFFLDLVTVRIPEVDNGEWSTSAWIVNDFLDDTFDVAISFGVVDGSELRCALPALGMSLEDRTGSFPLSTDYATHDKSIVSREAM